MGGEVEETIVEAFNQATRLPIADVSGGALKLLGQRIVTAALGLTDARQVKAYAMGAARPPQAREARLRLVYQVASIVNSVYGDSVARAFFVNANPQLGDESPLTVIADQDPTESQRAVITATRAFVEG